MNKSIIKSKTFWFQVLSIAAAVSGVIPVSAETGAIIVGLINIALLTALGREHELKLHLVGALRNGCTEEEIQGVLLHCCVYCGVAAGSAAFRTANEVIKEYRAENP